MSLGLHQQVHPPHFAHPPLEESCLLHHPAVPLRNSSENSLEKSAGSILECGALRWGGKRSRSLLQSILSEVIPLFSAKMCWDFSREKRVPTPPRLNAQSGCVLGEL